MPGDGGERDAAAAIDAWAASGAMALTGRADGPGLGPPAPLVERLSSVASLVATRSAQLGRRVELDPLGLLTERAAIAGLRRQGRTSCGGATRLLTTADGWIAVSLARADDVELVPAWLEAAVDPDDPWTGVEAAVRSRATAKLVERAVVLGLAAAALPASIPPPATSSEPLAPLPCRASLVDDGAATASLDGLVVADLSSLWAGPLCGAILADAGASVVKVESTTRPDGARRGHPAFFDLMNAGKRGVALDFSSAAGRRALLAFLEEADVVIEASRPRALQQLGIDAEALLRDAGPRAWVSITGHGRQGERGTRVGFGDDAAVAGGLVSWEGERPRFCADAVADPTTGLVAAVAVLDALAVGGSWLLDVAMSEVAAHLAGPTLAVPAGIEAAAPRAVRHRGSAPALGEHTAEVLSHLEVPR